MSQVYNYHLHIQGAPGVGARGVVFLPSKDVGQEPCFFDQLVPTHRPPDLPTHRSKGRLGPLEPRRAKALLQLAQYHLLPWDEDSVQLASGSEFGHEMT